MRIKITFSHTKDKTFIPINTNYYLVKLINQLSFEYHRYLNSLIPGKSRRKSFDMYTFSQLLIPEREVADFKIGILSKEFYWYISSPYYQFLGILARELREQKKAKISNTSFAVEQVDFLSSPDFKNAEAQFTCLSPVAVYRQQFKNRHRSAYQFSGGYILPNEQEYAAFVKRDLLQKYNTIQNKKLSHLDFDLEFDRNYIRRRNNKITKVITLEGNKRMGEQVRGVLAPLRVKAEPEVLKLIYDVGLGQLNDLGFGMVEMVPGRIHHS